jgi:hypothetical protein
VATGVDGWSAVASACAKSAVVNSVIEAMTVASRRIRGDNVAAARTDTRARYARISSKRPSARE